MKERIESRSESVFRIGVDIAALSPFILLGALLFEDFYDAYYPTGINVNPIECNKIRSSDVLELSIKEGGIVSVRKTAEDAKFQVKAIPNGEFNIKTRESVKILSKQVRIYEENIYLLPNTSIEIDIDGATYLITGLPPVNTGFNRISLKADCLD